MSKLGNLLLDQAPLVDAARALEQQRLRADRHRDVLRIGQHVGLERERALRPREQQVDRFLDLVLEVLVQLLALDVPRRHQQVAEAPLRLGACSAIADSSAARRDESVLDEDVAKPVATIDDGGVRDAPAFEVNRAELLPVRDRQAARLLPHGEQLQHVGEAGFTEAAANRHQRGSSTTRPSSARPLGDDLFRIEEEGVDA